MTRPRSQLISLETTPYYHCISRCVRGAWLCGQDTDGRNFDHRKVWIEQRLEKLANVFAIDLVSFSVMSNHYHVVLHVDSALAASFTDEEVKRRWGMLYRGPAIYQRERQGETLLGPELKLLADLVKRWRSELCNISRFMANMNYAIAVSANREDGCTGRFWEGRFISQALKDETALLGCMSYVDLNPVRAGIADNLEQSRHTSIRQRILTVKAGGKPPRGAPKLMEFEDTVSKKETTSWIPFKYRDYLELVDWYGRHVHPRKTGFIRKGTPKLLDAVGLNARQWQVLTAEIRKEASTMLHGLEKLERLEKRTAVSKAA